MEDNEKKESMLEDKRRRIVTSHWRRMGDWKRNMQMFVLDITLRYYWNVSEVLQSHP